MATKAQTQKPEAVKAAPAKEEVTYSADEFASAAEAVFGKGTSPDIVRAALRVAGVSHATKDQAKKLVVAFAKKEVM